MNNLLTLEELAQLLRISKNTLYYYIRRENLPLIRIGKHIRFDEEAVRFWIQEQQEKQQKGCDDAE